MNTNNMTTNEKVEEVFNTFSKKRPPMGLPDLIKAYFVAGHGSRDEEVKDLREALDWSTFAFTELLLKTGHRGSNEEDRMNDKSYEAIQDIRSKFNLDKDKKNIK